MPSPQEQDLEQRQPLAHELQAGVRAGEAHHRGRHQPGPRRFSAGAAPARARARRGAGAAGAGGRRRHGAALAGAPPAPPAALDSRRPPALGGPHAVARCPFLSPPARPSGLDRSRRDARRGALRGRMDGLVPDAGLRRAGRRQRLHRPLARAPGAARRGRLGGGGRPRPGGRRASPQAIGLPGRARATPSSSRPTGCSSATPTSCSCVHRGDGTAGALLDHLGRDALGHAIHWRCFGTGGRARWEDGLIHEQFVRAGDPSRHPNGFFKTLLREPRHWARLGDHAPTGWRGPPAARGLLDGEGRPIPGFPAGPRRGASPTRDRITHATRR